MKKMLILVSVLGVILAGLVIATLMSINPIIVRAVNTVGPKVLLTEVSLRRADVSFLSGSGRLERLMVGSPRGFAAPQTMKLRVVEVKLDTSTLTKDVVIIEKVLIEEPELTYEQSGKTDNFTALLNNVRQTVGGGESTSHNATPNSTQTQPAKKVIIKDLRITGAKANMALTALGGQGLTLTLPDIHLTNIGEESGGATPAEAVQQILDTLSGQMNVAVSGALQDSLKQMQDAAKGAADALKDGQSNVLDKAGSGLKKIFE